MVQGNSGRAYKGTVRIGCLLAALIFISGRISAISAEPLDATHGLDFTSISSLVDTKILNRNLDALAGAGGAPLSLDSTGGAGGNATQIYSATATKFEADIRSKVEGGAGGSADSTNGSGGDGGDTINSISGTSIASGRSGFVAVFTEAIGGTGGTAVGAGNVGGDGGASKAAAFGVASGRGDVTVTTRQTGGDGGRGLAGADGGDGATSSALNSVSGSSRKGTLTLLQQVSGGNGGSSESGVGGNAGNASSFFEGNLEGKKIDLAVYALAGSGGDTTTESGTAANGGQAVSQLELSGTGRLQGFSSAQAGGGGAIPFNLGGNGGVADSRSIVTALGTLPAFSGASAVGGEGAIGGAASAVSSVESQTSKEVSASSDASGGWGTQTPGNGTATATSIGKARSIAEAHAVGGVLFNRSVATIDRAGSAAARASASGKKATATAKATTYPNLFDGIFSKTEVSGSGKVTADARSTSSKALPPLNKTTSNAAISISGQPLESDTNQTLQGNPRAQEAALGRNSLILGSVAHSHLTGEATKSLDITTSIYFSLRELNPPYGEPIKLSLLNPTYLGDGFDKLTFEILIDGKTIEKSSFRSISDALGYFDDNVFDIYKDFRGFTIHYEFRVTTRSSPGDSFAFDFLFSEYDRTPDSLTFTAVAEPSPLALALLTGALIALAIRFKRDFANQ